MTDEIPVLALCGPAGVGKDMAAEWFCREKDFCRISFADPLKRFAQMVFGFSEETLWGPSQFRNALHDVDPTFWWGALQNFNKYAANWVRQVLNHPDKIDESKALISLMEWFVDARRHDPSHLSARYVLQTLGTEWGRNFAPDIWVQEAFRSIGKIREGCYYSHLSGAYYLPSDRPGEKKCNGVVIADLRFRNEKESVQKNGGYAIRLYRDAKPETEIGGIAGHVSEEQLKSIRDEEFNLIIHLGEGPENVYPILEEVYREKLWTKKGMILELRSVGERARPSDEMV